MTNRNHRAFRWVRERLRRWGIAAANQEGCATPSVSVTLHHDGSATVHLTFPRRHIEALVETEYKDGDET